MVRRAVLLILIIGALPIGPASAQATGLLVTPAQTERDLDDRSFEQVLTYRNEGARRLDVALTVRRLGHDLDGAPRFLRSAKHDEAFTLSRTSFSVDPDEQVRARLDGAIPEQDRSIYVGVVAEFSSGGAEGQTVEIRNQVAAQFLLRAPKPWRERIRVTDVGILPGAGDALTVYAVAENTGNVHVRPTARMEIRKDGELLARVRLGRPAGQVAAGPPAIIPGFARRLVGTWRPPKGLTGSIELTARFADPRASGSGIVELGAAGQAPPQVRIDTLNAEPAGGGIVTVQLVNDGTEPVEGVSVTLVAKEGDVERARTVLPARKLAAGPAPPETWEPQLGEGTYLIVGTAKRGSSVLDERVTDLRIGAGTAAAKARPWWITVVAVLLLVVALGLLFFVWKRKRDRDEAAIRTEAR